MARCGVFGARVAVMAGLTVTAEAAAQCYVDSNAGNDAHDGLTAATPVRSQAAIPASCTEVRYARGSVFFEPVAMGGDGFGGGGRRVFTAYGDPSLPRPAFVVTSGSVVSSFGGGVTIDGLRLEGSRGDGTMENLMQGVCVLLGGGSQILNSEITNCDIGIMLMGEGSRVQGNVIHDLHMAVDSTDTSVYANSVGGAEGIFVNGSNNEVAYNTFFNCKDTAAWTGGNCDGGATEVAVPRDGEISGLRIHHNLSYNNCGFFEVSGFGTFRDSEFYYNVSIDSNWMGLLQVNETTLANISYTNNTVVHHPESQTPAIFMIYGEDQGAGQLQPGTVSFVNNLVIFAGAQTFMATVDDRITQANNLIVTGDPGVVNVSGTSAEDFDLVAGSPAIDAGQVTTYGLDFLNRTVPDPSGVPDGGAFEHGSSVGAPRPAVAAPEPSPARPAEAEGGCGCVVAAGSRGTSGARWVPMLFGAALLAGRRRRAHRR